MIANNMEESEERDMIPKVSEGKGRHKQRSFKRRKRPDPKFTSPGIVDVLLPPCCNEYTWKRRSPIFVPTWSYANHRYDEERPKLIHLPSSQVSTSDRKKRQRSGEEHVSGRDSLLSACKVNTMGDSSNNNKKEEYDADILVWKAFERYLMDGVPVKIADFAKFRRQCGNKTDDISEGEVNMTKIPPMTKNDVDVEADVSDKPPAIKVSSTEKVDRNVVNSNDDDDVDASMAERIIRKLNLPKAALDALITVQCKLRRKQSDSSLDKPAATSSDSYNVKLQWTGEKEELSQKGRKPSALEISKALSVVHCPSCRDPHRNSSSSSDVCGSSRDDDDDENITMFLGQEDQLTTQMTLRDVLDCNYDTERLHVCVAQETILSSRVEAESSPPPSPIVCHPDGRISLNETSSDCREKGAKSLCISSSPPFPLAALAPSIRAPSLLLPEDKIKIREVNFWCAPHSSCTNVHYDGNHNLLLVLHGYKTVELSPPGAIRGSYISSEHANHPALLRPSVIRDGDINDDVQEELSSTKECLNQTTIVVSVSEGEGLFIPEGWWHRVESSAFCVAVNFWFDHTRSSLSLSSLVRPTNKHMLSYHVRELARRYVEEHFVDTAKQFVRKALSEFQIDDAFAREVLSPCFGRRTCLLEEWNSDDGTVPLTECEFHQMAQQVSTYISSSLFEDRISMGQQQQYDTVGIEKKISRCGRLLNLFLLRVNTKREDNRKSVLWLLGAGFPKLTSPYHQRLFRQLLVQLEMVPCSILDNVWEQHASWGSEESRRKRKNRTKDFMQIVAMMTQRYDLTFWDRSKRSRL